MMESDEIENQVNWKNFLHPLPSRRKIKNGRTIKICDKKKGNECLSQEFAIKLMKEKPYSIKIKKPKAEEDTAIQQNKAPSVVLEQVGIGVCDQLINEDISKEDEGVSFTCISAAKPSFSKINETNENSRDYPIEISDDEPCTSDPGIFTKNPITSDTFQFVKQRGTFLNTCNLKVKQRRNGGKLYPAIKNKRPLDNTKFSVVAHMDPQADKYTVQRRRKRARNSFTKSARMANKKDDFDLPCSQWNIVLLSRYFSFKSCVEKLELREHIDNHDVILDKIIEDFKYRMTIASSNVKQNVEKTDETLNFISLCSTEIGARLVLNEIMFPLCAYMGLSIEIEKNVNCVFLPMSRFDYRIVNSDGDVVGAVEAKSAGSLCQESIAQAIVQLCVLQTEHLDKKDTAQVINTPLFNILTDGIRYVFIVLQGKKLQFEQVDDRVSVREVRSWEDVNNLFRALLSLMRKQTLPPEIIDLSNENDVELIEMTLI
ncbi:uncharacterized protein LOC133185972 [Saccostrea echinata]|uniref:uncharacterized protein LOC133185972 n=1 Tax=Saccostrea echinata TaxID=191078 RepID=UPI002A836BEE|nr:uncharacterized protein LOC133185972 [Saccostrea echinata]XP_061177242.1 uncharacterized protein LOC133185972 [Saccostrea echinata]